MMMILSATTRQRGKNEISPLVRFVRFVIILLTFRKEKRRSEQARPRARGPVGRATSNNYSFGRLDFVFAPRLRTNNTRGTKQLRDRR